MGLLLLMLWLPPAPCGVVVQPASAGWDSRLTPLVLLHNLAAGHHPQISCGETCSYPQTLVICLSGTPATSLARVLVSSHSAPLRVLVRYPGAPVAARCHPGMPRHWPGWHKMPFLTSAPTKT